MYLVHVLGKLRRRRVLVSVLVLAFFLAGVMTAISGLAAPVSAQGPPPTLEIPDPPAIFGDIYNDANGNGVYDRPDEGGIPGAKITLTLPSALMAQGGSGILAETVSDAHGFFYFTSLTQLGLYTVDVAMPADYVAEAPTSFQVLVGADKPAKAQVGGEVRDLYLSIVLYRAATQ